MRSLTAWVKYWMARHHPTPIIAFGEVSKMVDETKLRKIVYEYFGRKVTAEIVTDIRKEAEMIIFDLVRQRRNEVLK